MRHSYKCAIRLSRKEKVFELSRLDSSLVFTSITYVSRFWFLECPDKNYMAYLKSGMWAKI
jgi:hypothetical protein